MKHKWMLIFLGALMLSGLFFVFYFGIQPRPVKKIKMSRFDTPNVLAGAVFLRLNEELKAASILILGVEATHREAIQFLDQFTAYPSDEKLTYTRILWDQRLGDPWISQPVEAFSLPENSAQIMSVLKQDLQEGRRTLVITEPWQSSQVIQQSGANQIKAQINESVTSLTVLNFPRNPAEEKDYPIKCDVGTADTTGLGPLGCLVRLKAKMNYRKKYPPGSLVGTVDLVGLTDYLILLTTEK